MTFDWNIWMQPSYYYSTIMMTIEKGILSPNGYYVAHNQVEDLLSCGNIYLGKSELRQECAE